MIHGSVLVPGPMVWHPWYPNRQMTLQSGWYHSMWFVRGSSHFDHVFISTLTPLCVRISRRFRGIPLTLIVVSSYVTSCRSLLFHPPNVTPFDLLDNFFHGVTLPRGLKHFVRSARLIAVILPRMQQPQGEKKIMSKWKNTHRMFGEHQT